MKILLISNLYPSAEFPSYGIFVKNVEIELKKFGFDFEMAVISGKASSSLDKIKKYLVFFSSVLFHIKKNDYDIIYVHYVKHSLIPFLLMNHLIEKPLVLNAHGSDVLEGGYLSVLIQKLVTPIIKRSDLMVVPSEYFQKLVIKKYGIENSKCFISPSGGVDTNVFCQGKKQNRNYMFTVGFLSRIDKGKGWNVLLKSVYFLKEKSNLRVLMVGSGSEEKQMKNMIKQLGLNEIVKTFSGQSHNKVPYFFNQMDIFVFPTTRAAESLGLVGLEAMACGIPVLGSNIGGLPGYIRDGVNGHLFEAGNSKQLAKYIELFMDMDASEFANFKRQAYETAKMYDSKRVASELAYRLKELGNPPEN